VKSALHALKFKFAARSCSCGQNVTIINPAVDTLDVHCADCGVKRGLLSQRTAKFLRQIVGTFGAPDHPIILRRKPE
jgi:hypothetical protein